MWIQQAGAPTHLGRDIPEYLRKVDRKRHGQLGHQTGRLSSHNMATNPIVPETQNPNSWMKKVNIIIQ
jgi:hypothetical protein